jgi:anaerobic selenocysteine-containing dehydrogenase
MMEQLGAIGPPCSYDDIALADIIVIVGEDLATTHPVLYAHVVEAVTSRGATLVVVDPRVTATSLRTRSVHVPVRAGGEVALFNSIAHVLVHELEVSPSQWAVSNTLNAAAQAEYVTLYDPEYDVNERIDAVHLKELCDGPAEWVDSLGNRDANGFLKSFDVPTITGLDPDIVRDLAKRWNAAGRVMTIWSSRIGGAGDGGAAVSSILGLHLLTGQMGRPGTGVLGLHATASGRGAVDSGATPLTLPGGYPAGTDTAPGSLAEAWGAEFAEEANRLPPGLGLVDLMRQAARGDPYLLLLLGGSVTEQVPDRVNLVEPALRTATVVSTAAHLEDPDVAWADLVLPRLSWYEREGHYVSSERRIERSLPSLAPLEGPRTELEVLNEVGSRMVSGPLFASTTPLLVMDEFRTAAKGAPVDLSHLPLGDDLTESRGIQWPVPTERSASLKGSARRHMGQDGLGPGFPTETGKAVILPREHPGLRMATSPDYPLTAVVGIDPATWWDGRFYQPSVGNVIRHATLEPAYVEVVQEDAEALGLAEGDTALVTSAQGHIELPVRYAEEGTAAGHVFLPWGCDARTQSLSPSFPLDRNGVPPWTSFPVRVEPV